MAEIELDLAEMIEPFVELWRAEVAAAGVARSLLEPMNQWLLDQGGKAGDYVRSRHQLQRWGRALVQTLAPYDCLVLPTCTATAIAIGAWADLPPEEVMARIMDWISPSPAFNVTGQPALAIPTGRDSAGLPLGVQLVGRPGDEAALLRLGAYLEHCCDFPVAVPRL